MRRLLAAAAGLLLALAGCSADGGSPRADTVSVSPSATPSPTAGAATEAQLAGALLAVGDLPTGWSVDDDEDDDDEDPIQGCPELAALDDRIGERPNAEVSFARAELGPFFSESAGTFRDAGDAAAAVRRLTHALGSCPSFTYTDDDGKKQRARIAALSFPQVGDETFAARMSVEFEGGRISVDFAVVRVRQHVLLLAGTSVTTVFGGGQLDPADLERLVRAAVTKASGALP
ncbi:MAG TPA: hypothetical protein VF519_13090 [Mycobacteriales bacterium]|jgi:hypothetical protein